MYDPDAAEYAGLHNPTQEPGCELAVFRAKPKASTTFVTSAQYGRGYDNAKIRY
jgi:hypothetical protein